MAFNLALSTLLAVIVHLAACAGEADPGLAWIWPPPVGFDLTSASVAPCGGFNTTHDGNTTYFLDQLRWNQTAAEITYMTRVSRNLDANGGWEELYPTIEAAVEEANAQKNAAQFCVPIPEKTDPDQTNVFQLIANTPLGIVFACSKVRFSRNADRAYSTTCIPSIRGNSTVNNVTDQSLMSAALLPAGATATATSSSQSSSTGGAVSQGQPTLVPQSKHGLSGGAIAGAVVGSLAGGCAIIFVIVLFLMRRRQRPMPMVAKRSSDVSSSGFSAEDNVDLEDKTPAELPAAVPAELDSTARVEMPASEKDFRPEPSSSRQAGPLPEKMPMLEEERPSPVNGDDDSLYSQGNTPRPSPAVTAVSPATSHRNSIGETLSPVSPVSPALNRADRHFP